MYIVAITHSDLFDLCCLESHASILSIVRSVTPLAKVRVLATAAKPDPAAGSLMLPARIPSLPLHALTHCKFACAADTMRLVSILGLLRRSSGLTS